MNSQSKNAATSRPCSVKSTSGHANRLKIDADRHFERGNLHRALMLVSTLVILHRKAGDTFDEARTLRKAGMLQFMLRRHAAAVESYTRALDLFADRADIGNRIVTMQKLSEVHQHTGHHIKALDVLEECLVLCGEDGDNAGMAVVLNNVAVSLREIGRHEEAVRACTVALKIRHELGDDQGKAALLHNLGSICLDQGKLERARQHLIDALHLYQIAGDQGGLGRTTLFLGKLHEEKGDRHRAMMCYDQALRVARQPDVASSEDEAAALYHLAGVAIALDAHDKALEFLRDAVRILTSSGMEGGLASALYYSGVAHKQLGQREQALHCLDQALAIQETIGDRDGLASTLIAIASVRMEQHDLGGASHLLVRAVLIREKLGNLHDLANARYMLGKLCELQGKRDEALRHYLSVSFVLDHANGMESEHRERNDDDEMLRSPPLPEDPWLAAIDFDESDFPNPILDEEEPPDVLH